VFLQEKQIWWESSELGSHSHGDLRCRRPRIEDLRRLSIGQEHAETFSWVRRIERVAAIRLWSFIAVGVILLLIFER
jgi:hypothetical protein